MSHHPASAGSEALRGAAAHIQSTTPSSLGSASIRTVHSTTRRRVEEMGSEATAAATRYGNTEPSSRLACSSVGPTRLPNAVTESKSRCDDVCALALLQLLHCAPASPHVRRAAWRHSAQLPPWLSRSRSAEQVDPSLQRSRGRSGRPSSTEISQSCISMVWWARPRAINSQRRVLLAMFGDKFGGSTRIRSRVTCAEL